jgi:hypothetical protein
MLVEGKTMVGGTMGDGCWYALAHKDYPVSFQQLYMSRIYITV